jgi:N-formylglutamate deformylase
MRTFEVVAGNSPVLLGIPHTGSSIPDAIWDRLNDNGRALADTDWLCVPKT